MYTTRGFSFHSNSQVTELIYSRRCTVLYCTGTVELYNFWGPKLYEVDLFLVTPKKKRHVCVETINTSAAKLPRPWQLKRDHLPSPACCNAHEILHSPTASAIRAAHLGNKRTKPTMSHSPAARADAVTHEPEVDARVVEHVTARQLQQLFSLFVLFETHRA